MSPLKFLPYAALTLVIATGLPALAQQPQQNSGFKIEKVEATFVETPMFSVSKFTKSVPNAGRSQPWLQIETSFDWLPPVKDPLYADDVTVTYYVLLKKATQQDPKGVMLSGSVTHVSVPQAKDLHSVMYISPRSLERVFDGKVPTTVQQLFIDVGVTISYKGQEVAFASANHGTGEWWATPGYKPTPGFLLNKSETPFAPLLWDYYEAIKPKSGQ